MNRLLPSVLVLVAFCIAWMALLSAASPVAMEKVGTYQIACSGQYRVTCATIDTRTGTVVFETVK